MKSYYFVATALLALTLVSLPQKQARADAALVRSFSNPAIYYVYDGKRYAFPNEKTFFTWYKDFSQVSIISESALAALPLAGNVTYRPGVKMIKITTDPKVYEVAATA